MFEPCNIFEWVCVEPLAAFRNTHSTDLRLAGEGSNSPSEQSFSDGSGQTHFEDKREL